MRISANLVESLLISAQNEVAAERRENRALNKDAPVDFSTVIAAFRRAAELAQENFIYRKVRGRKSGVKQTVITTAQRKTDGNVGHSLVEYTLCLLPYSGRRPFKYEVDKTDERDKTSKTTIVVKSAIPIFREQWIRTDRLEAA
jgi:hypothetical protein